MTEKAQAPAQKPEKPKEDRGAKEKKGKWAASIAAIRETIEQQMKQLQTGGAGAEKTKSAGAREQGKPSEKPKPAAVSAGRKKAQGNVEDNAANETKGN